MPGNMWLLDGIHVHGIDERQNEPSSVFRWSECTGEIAKFSELEFGVPKSSMQLRSFFVLNVCLFF
jgi:hypothetical protein